MASTTAYQGLPFPDPTDPDAVPADLQALAEAVDGKLVMVFSSSGVRDAAIGVPTSGMVAFLQDELRLSFYDGTAWRKGTIVQAGLDSARPSAASVPEGTLYYETNQNLLKGQVGGSWTILNAVGEVGGSDTNASANTLTTTEKVLHTITLPANPDYQLSVFVMGYVTFGGGTGSDDIIIRLKNGNGTGGTLKAYGMDRAPTSGWGHVAMSDTLTIPKGSTNAERTFVLTGEATTGGDGHAPRSNANATGIDYVAMPKNL